MKNLLLGLSLLLSLSACGGGGEKAQAPDTSNGSVSIKPEFTHSCDDVGFCTFDGSASTITGGTINSYTWDFGNGQTSSGLTTSFDYAQSGNYAVRLVVGGSGVSSQVVKTVTVTLDQSPTAEFIYSCADLDCFFDASGSSDDVAIDSYEWDLGDGNTATGVTVDHTYLVSGTYTVILTVFDSKGQIETYPLEVQAVSSSAVADYKPYLVEMFELSLFTLDMAQSMYSVKDFALSVSEGEGAKDLFNDANNVSGACPLGGSYTYEGWEDGNGNSEVDLSEEVLFSMDNCVVHVSAKALSLPSASRFSSFGVSAHSSSYLDGFNRIGYDSGFNFEDNDGYVSVHKSNGILNYYNQNGALEQQSFGYSDLAVIDMDNPHNDFTGVLELLYAPSGAEYQVHSFSVDTDNNNPSFTVENDAYVMKSGVIVSSYYSDHIDADGSELLFSIRITVDVDTAYLYVEVDSNGSGQYDLSDRFLQSALITYF